MGVEVDPSLCPVCGKPNTCGMTQGKSECWCFDLTIDRAALARIPLEAKDRACLCPRCAALANDAEAV